MKKKIIVTGGLGFIGKNFVKSFYKKYDKILIIDKVTHHSDKNFIKRLDNSKIELIEKDIGKISFDEISNIHKYDIINFASESHVDRSFINPIFFSEANYLSTHNFLEKLRLIDFSGKFLHISTDEVYGESKFKPVAEDDLLKPTNPYSASKAASDILCQTYNKCYNLNIVILRPNNVYGEFQHVEKIIPAAISAIYKNKKIKIQGDGLQKRSFLNTTDFNNACAKLFDLDWNNLNERIFNIGSNNEFTILDLVKKIVGFSNKKFEHCVEFVENRPFNDFRYLISTKRIEELGWVQHVDFDYELKKLFDAHSVFYGNT